MKMFEKKSAWKFLVVFFVAAALLAAAIPSIATDKNPWFEENESLSTYPQIVRDYFDSTAKGMNTEDVKKVNVPSVNGASGGSGTPGTGHGSAAAGDQWKYTTTEELINYIQALPKTHMRTGIIGSFPDYDADRTFKNEWHDMILAVFSEKGDVFTPEEVKALGKPVVYVQGSIHGNEPSGSDGALELARRVANGDFNEVLKKVTLVLLPRWNLDGAKHTIRGTNVLAGRPGSEMGFDQNRDHIVMQSYFSMTVHRVALDYKPVAAIDLHEMGFTNGNSMPAGSAGYPWHYQRHDIATEPGQNPNIPKAVIDFAYDVFMKNFEKDLNAKNIEWHYYDENIANETYIKTEVLSADLSVVQGEFPAQRKYHMSEGTNDEGIGRPNFGFLPASSFLAETRSPNGFASYLRRVYTHYLTAASLLNTAASHADELKKQQTDGSQEMINNKTLILRLRFPAVKEQWPITNWRPGFTGLVDTSYEAVMYRSRNAVADPDVQFSSVPKPTAYIIPDTDVMRNVVGKLSINGVKFERLTADTSLNVEVYTINKISNSVSSPDVSPADMGVVGFKLNDPISGKIRNKAISAVSTGISAVSKTTKTVTLPKGTFVMYTDQVPATAAALALEPMGQRNFANYYLTQISTDPNKIAYCRDEGFFEVRQGGEYPIYRYAGAKSLPTYKMPGDLPPFIEDSPLAGLGTITDAELADVKTALSRSDNPIFASKFRVLASPTKKADGSVVIAPVQYKPTSGNYDYYVLHGAAKTWDPLTPDANGKFTIDKDHFTAGGYLGYYKEAFVVAYSKGGSSGGGSSSGGGCDAGFGVAAFLIVGLLGLKVTKKK
ncbi:hypothetical protein AGMMS50276_15190 [Synergistales bacterium]|nr:hypothetical protein AGMMS50276_15190 [Synergistales bacterium]